MLLPKTRRASSAVEVLVAHAPQVAEGGRRRPRGGGLFSSLTLLAEGSVLVDHAKVIFAHAPQAAAGSRVAAGFSRRSRSSPKALCSSTTPKFSSLTLLRRPQAAAWRQAFLVAHAPRRRLCARRQRRSSRRSMAAAGGRVAPGLSRRSGSLGGRRRPRGGRPFTPLTPLADGFVLVDNVEVLVTHAPQAAAGGREAGDYPPHNLSLAITAQSKAE